MNSSADIKAFTGRHGGTVCTSSNAKRALEWRSAKASKVLFLPDQHPRPQHRRAAVGMSLDDCVVFDPHKPGGGLTEQQLRDADDDPVARSLLGARSLHRRRRRRRPRARSPASTCWCIPSARTKSSPAPTSVGSTEFIIKTIRRRAGRVGVGGRHRAQPGHSGWGVVTRTSRSCSWTAPCFCSTMNRIDLPHLVWALENLARGTRGQPDHGR